MTKGADKRLRHRSIIMMSIILIIGFGAAFCRIAQLSIIDGEGLKQRAVDQQLTDTTINAKRGTIYDTNGKVLAQSATVWKVVIAPINLKDDEQRTVVARGLAQILDLDQEDVFEKTKEQSYYVQIKRQVENEQKEQILKFEDELEEDYDITGVIDLIEDYKRYYPYGDFASSVIGFTGSDNQGLAGVEYQYDSQLTGTPGRLVTAKNANGQEMPFEYDQKVDAEDGQNLTLTIDETVQHVLEKYLDLGIKEFKVYNRAVAIMMEVDTGNILGMAVENGYDLNNPFEVVSSEAKKTISALATDQQAAAENEELAKQWRNKAISDTYYPGSVFKIFTSSMALEENVINEESTFNCTGSYVPVEGGQAISCWNTAGHGLQTFPQALCNSCNPAFMQIGQRVGEAKFWEYYQAFGFSEKTGIDLPGEADDIFFSLDGSMQPMDLAVASFGQNFSITPIQMITALSAVANGGSLVQPHVVRQITDSNGNVTQTASTEVKRQVISESTSATMRKILEQNATSGSAKNGYVAGYRVCGKTGTSEKKVDVNNDGNDDYIASYAGFAPANDPKVALLVYFDSPIGSQYYGSQVAAPQFANMMSELLPYLDIETQYNSEELKALDTTASSYVGMSTSEAKAKVAEDGFEVIVKGSGDKVVSQVPAADSRIPQGGKLVLYTDSTSEKDTVVVPDLTKLTVSEANSVASQYDLNISVYGSNTAKEGTSYTQDIAAGSKVPIGTVITVSFEVNSGYGDGVM